MWIRLDVKGWTVYFRFTSTNWIRVGSIYRTNAPSERLDDMSLIYKSCTTAEFMGMVQELNVKPYPSE